MTKEKTILPTLKLELKNENLTSFCGLVVFGRARNGKPVNTKLSISSGVSLLRSHVSTLNLE